MKLSKVQIRQFRSIRELDITFSHRCQILLGINETGKTNILHALALLDSSRKMCQDDRRQLTVDEDPTDEFVRFVFDLEEEDISELLNHLSDTIAGNLELLGIKSNGQQMSLSEFVRRVARQGLYQADLDDGNRHFSVWRIDEDITIDDGWLAFDEYSGSVFDLDHPRRGTAKSNSILIAHSSHIEKSNAPDSLPSASGKNLVKTVQNWVKNRVKTELPECIFWSFQEDQVLPSSIEWNRFIKNPNVFPVLKNMFDLAGIQRLTTAVDEAEKKTTGLIRLLERVGKRTTDYLRSRWDGFEGLSVELHKDGDLLRCIIRDKEGAYSFQQRSDGFRRIVSFLLMISTRNPSGTLKNALLLYDEPDTSLHPSGAKQLRDELIRLSENNLIFYSTHSIFMVDPDNVERHWIVKRENEITTIKQAQFGNIVDEEVLYRAIGHSVFDVLKQRNIILEGWRDKKLILTALDSCEKKTKEFFEKVGICHAGGVKNIPQVAPMIETLSRPFVVVTDADQTARQAQSKSESKWPWRLYSDYVGKRFLTAEDFIDGEYLKESVEFAATEVKELQNMESINRDASFMPQVERALSAAPKEKRSRILNRLKERIFGKLESKHLREEATQMVEGIMKDLLDQQNEGN